MQSARLGTISEANGRSSLYLGTLSSATIAIAFIGQANELGDTFYLFALTLLPPVFLLGIFTFLRLVQTGIEDYIYGLGTVRIREYFLRLDPAAAPFFLPTDPEGIKKLQRMGMIPTSPFQGLLTVASMVACINAIVGGVTIALAVRSLLDTSARVAAVTGGPDRRFVRRPLHGVRDSGIQARCCGSPGVVRLGELRDCRMIGAGPGQGQVARLSIAGEPRPLSLLANGLDPWASEF